MVASAITKVKEHLKSVEDYDTTNWQVADPYISKDDNIISGVIKHGRSIIIVIRPTDGSKVKFYHTLEKEALSQPDTELWGSNSITGASQLITFGNLLLSNEINEFSLL